MKSYKVIPITALAVAGSLQLANADFFPTSAGLFVYDVTTGTLDSGTEMANGTYLFAGSIGSSLGGYTLTIATGQTVQGGVLPFLDLDISAVVPTDPGNGTHDTLEVFYSDGAFGPSAPSYVLQTTGSGPVTSSAYASSSYKSSPVSLGGGADSNFPLNVNATGNLPLSSYYLTIEDTITGDVTSLDTQLYTLPEPKTVVAALLMLLPLAVGTVRSLRKDRIS